jgi:outer membrane protein assembly factor BamA
LHSPDSLTIDKNKIHAGLSFNFENDQRDNKILTTKGFFFDLKLQAYNGLNKYSRSFIQFFPEFSVYQHLDRKSIFVIAERVGGGTTLGKTNFYQSVFLGGQENLLGYRKYRFAGDHTLYNNLELRMRLKKVESYFLPGQLGILGFYDVGRVWQKGESSDKWHTGTGAGLYYSPIQKAVLKITAGHSEEGWYPYVNIGFRY